MKTTIDIPDDELSDAMRFTRAKTKREAVVTAIADFNRRRMAEFVKYAGTCPDLMTVDELLTQRRKRVQTVDPDLHLVLDSPSAPERRSQVHGAALESADSDFERLRRVRKQLLAPRRAARRRSARGVPLVCEQDITCSAGHCRAYRGQARCGYRLRRGCSGLPDG